MTDEMKRYYATRQRFTPEQGHVYENQGGGFYACLKVGGFLPDQSAVMMNVLSHWEFTAHDCGQYEDGKIDWDYSTGGHFKRGGLICQIGKE